MKTDHHELNLQRKIKKACHLLRQKHSLTVKEVAQKLDFCSCDTFIRFFKKHIGTTPGEFRKICRSFDGFCNRRKGTADRRSRKGDRRGGSGSGKLNLAISVYDREQSLSSKDRRLGYAERRRGPADRRKIIQENYKK